MKHQYTKEEIIKEVKKGSKVGKEEVETHLEFLRALGKGEIYKGVKKND